MNIKRELGVEPIGVAVSASVLNSKLARPDPELEALGVRRAARQGMVEDPEGSSLPEAKTKAEAREARRRRKAEARIVGAARVKRYRTNFQRELERQGADNFSTLRIVDSFVSWHSARSKQGAFSSLKRAGVTLRTLANFAGKSLECYPSKTSIAERGGCSVRTVYDHLKRLEALGLISSTSDGAKGALRGRTDLYQIHVAYMLHLMQESAKNES